jgi:transglutaminase-like putative cysteine protease
MTTSAHTLPTVYEAPAAHSPSERLQRGGGWWTLVLALLMLVAVTESLNTAAWSEGLEIVRLAILGGALLSFMLALTRWDGAFPVVYSILASLVWIATLFTQLLFDDMTLREGAIELFQRNVNWIRALIDGTSGADNLIFVTQLSILGWWIGYLAIWSLFRHQRLLSAVIPSGVALLVNAYYSSAGMTPYLVLFAAAVLLLAIRVELARNETRWQVTRVRYAPDITLDFLKAGLGFTALVLILAWAMPDVTQNLTVERMLRPFEGPWQRVEDTWNRMYKSLNYGSSTTQVSSFGKSMSFGGPVNLTDRPIFDAEAPTRTYWRAAAYDRYSSGGWQNTSPDVVVFDSNELFREPQVDGTKAMTVTVYPLEQGQELIFAPPQPQQVNVPVTADIRLVPNPDSPNEPLQSISLLRSRIRIDPETGYQVVSATSEASPNALRKDTGEYPGWVAEQYLQVPESVPARVRELAAEITVNTNNAFDKANAIEKYLRTYTYNQAISAPPAGQDGVDYFLFDVKEGYCDYYASAMAVMLRSVGVPARFVVGYTPGQPKERNEQSDDAPLYRVLERNAHAWPEVYFPSYGWVQFEPTASEPLLSRPIDPLDDLDAGLIPDQGPASLGEDEQALPELPQEIGTATAVNQLSAFQRWLQGNWGWLAALAVAGAALTIGWGYLRRRQIDLFRDSEVLARLFALLGTWANRLSIPWRSSQTPLERAAAFNARLPEAAPAVDTIAGLFIAQQYGRQQPPSESITRLAKLWRQLQLQLWRQWLVGQVRAPAAEKPAKESRSK